MKQHVDDYVGTQVDLFTVSHPPYFDDDQKRQLSHSLITADILDSSCHALATSATTATWAHRQTQMLVSPRNALQCVHGNFGIETVISIEHGQAALTVQQFELYVSDDMAEILPHSWQSHVDIFLKSASNGNDDDFWTKVTSHLQKLLASSSNFLYPEKVYRLVITGSLANDSRLSEALANSTDELLPYAHDGNVPLAARMFFSPPSSLTPEEWDKQREGTHPQHGELSSLTQMFYNNFMLSQVREQDMTGRIEPQFASARGAALLGIDSRLRPCSRGSQCEFARCPEKTKVKLRSWGKFYLIAMTRIMENHTEYDRHTRAMAANSRLRVEEFLRSLRDEDREEGHSAEL